MQSLIRYWCSYVAFLFVFNPTSCWLVYSRLDWTRVCEFLLQIQAGLSALKDALDAGFEDFKVDVLSESNIPPLYKFKSFSHYDHFWQRIREDPDLENIRKSEEFDPLLKKYDESFINENAINAIKSLFGFNKKWQRLLGNAAKTSRLSLDAMYRTSSVERFINVFS